MFQYKLATVDTVLIVLVLLNADVEWVLNVCVIVWRNHHHYHHRYYYYYHPHLFRRNAWRDIMNRLPVADMINHNWIILLFLLTITNGNNNFSSISFFPFPSALPDGYVWMRSRNFRIKNLEKKEVTKPGPSGLCHTAGWHMKYIKRVMTINLASALGKNRIRRNYCCAIRWRQYLLM